MSKLYIVATPIGNLSDISIRALEVLKSVDAILCEDTRTSQKLLSYYKIKKRLISYHEFSQKKKEEQILSLLKDNNELALITDAGTPLISDPGARLIKILKEKEAFNIIPIPGPSALTCALSVCPWPFEKFVFLGFLPHKKGRSKKIQEIFQYNTLVLLYESKHRLVKLLDELNEFDDYKLEIFLAREMTKQFESYYQGSPQDLLNLINDQTLVLKGEFVLILKYEKK
jgi:16S rRNA (cytidine1402-2'-O)-methyltransferase